AWIAAMNAAFGDATALMCPTVPVVAPPLASITDDAEYTRLNLLMLRNPSIINFWDGCAISLPCHRADLGELPVGLMLAAPGGHDDALLGLAQAVEQALRDTAS
ncbi:MAG: amidase, partial [Betaproteobacteria bacterium]|nr:amidase [Betaproteobacteria bacterium]